MSVYQIPKSPHDELGTPDEQLERCETHDVIYRTGEQCLICERGDGDA